MTEGKDSEDYQRVIGGIEGALPRSGRGMGPGRV